MSSPAPSALARRSRSHRCVLITAKLSTASTPVGHVGEVGRRQVGGDAGDAGGDQPVARVEVGEAGHARHLVIPSQRRGHGLRHLPGHAGDDDPVPVAAPVLGGSSSSLSALG